MSSIVSSSERTRRSRPTSIEEVTAHEDVVGGHRTIGLVVRSGLLLLVTATPWVFGGVNPQWQTLVCWGVVGLVILAAVDVAAFSTKICIPTVLIPLLIGVLIGLMQLVPLTPATLARLSPIASLLWTADGLPLADSNPTETKATLSLYPASTRFDTSRLVLAALVLLLGSRYFADSTSQWWLWTTMLLNGMALSVFGIVQQLTWNGRLYWQVEPAHVTTAFGPYVNHNNAAGFLNMCLAGALPFLLIEGNVSPGEARSGFRSNAFLRGLGVTGLACIMAGIAASLSRGAFVAMLVAGAVVLMAALVVQRRASHIGRLAFAVVASAAFLIWAGVSQPVQARLETLLDQKKVQQNERFEHWREASAIVPDFFRTGSGLGTYRYIYPLYRSAPVEELYYHAENQYLETLVEAGVGGLIALTTALGLSLFATVRLLQRGHRAEAGFALAALFVLLSQAIHSTLDFGLYLPANTMLFALIVGGVAGRASLYEEFTSQLRSLVALPEIHSHSIRWAFSLALIAYAGFPLSESRTAEAGADLQSRLRRDSERPVPLTDRIAQLQEATSESARCADDLDVQVALSRAWIDAYSEQASLRLQASTTSSNSSIRELVSTGRLHDTIAELLRRGKQADVDRLRRDRAVSDNLFPALNHLVAARRSTPLSPWVQFRLSELLALQQNPEEIRTLDAFAQSAWRRSDLMYSAGRIHLAAGRTPSAFRDWRVCLSASDEFLPAILRAAESKQDFVTLIDQLLPRSPEYLLRLAHERYADETSREHQLLLAAAERLRPNSVSPSLVSEPPTTRLGTAVNPDETPHDSERTPDSARFTAKDSDQDRVKNTPDSN